MKCVSRTPKNFLSVLYVWCERCHVEELPKNSSMSTRWVISGGLIIGIVDASFLVSSCRGTKLLEVNPSAHRMTQHPPPVSPFSNVKRAALVAASNTSSTPSPVSDEHSRYFLAPMSLAICDPFCDDTKCCDFLRISSMANGSSRRSFLRPTRIIGTPGQRSFASSTHCEKIHQYCPLNEVQNGPYLMLDIV